MRRVRRKQLSSPTVSPIPKEKDGGVGCISENQVYPHRYSINSVVQLVRDIASREISDKEVQVCMYLTMLHLNATHQISTVSAVWNPTWNCTETIYRCLIVLQKKGMLTMSSAY